MSSFEMVVGIRRGERRLISLDLPRWRFKDIYLSQTLTSIRVHVAQDASVRKETTRGKDGLVSSLRCVIRLRYSSQRKREKKRVGALHEIEGEKAEKGGKKITERTPVEGKGESLR
jgi:hypothetical protein